MNKRSFMKLTATAAAASVVPKVRRVIHFSKYEYIYVLMFGNSSDGYWFNHPISGEKTSVCNLGVSELLYKGTTERTGWLRIEQKWLRCA